MLEKSGNEFGFAYPLIQYTFSLEKGRKGDFWGVWKYWEKIKFSRALRLQESYPREWDDCNTFLWLFLMVVLICFVCHDLSHLLGEVFVVLLFPISHKWVNFWEGPSPVFQIVVRHHQQMKGLYPYNTKLKNSLNSQNYKKYSGRQLSRIPQKSNKCFCRILARDTENALSEICLEQNKDPMVWFQKQLSCIHCLLSWAQNSSKLFTSQTIFS